MSLFVIYEYIISLFNHSTVRYPKTITHTSINKDINNIDWVLEMSSQSC